MESFSTISSQVFSYFHSLGGNLVVVREMDEGNGKGFFFSHIPRLMMQGGIVSCGSTLLTFFRFNPISVLFLRVEISNPVGNHERFFRCAKYSSKFDLRLLAREQNAV